MGKVIDKFGNIVSGLVPEHPERARRLLNMGFRLNGLAQKTFSKKDLPPSRKYAATFSNDCILRVLAHPERSALASIFTPCELLEAFSILPMCAEAYSGYISGAAAEKVFVEAAESAGITETLCSYHKVIVGSAYAGVLPKPLCIVNTSLICDANNLTFRSLAEHYGVPQYYIDVPPEKSAESLAYVADELRGLKDFLEKTTGRRLDEGKLRDCVARSGRTFENLRACMLEKRGKYLKNDMVSEMYEILAMHIYLGLPQAEKYSQMLLRDLKNAEPVPGLRLLWLHVLPNCMEPMQALFTEGGRCQIITDDLNFDALEDMDPDKPYESMARRLVYNIMNGSIDDRIDKIEEICRLTEIDGVISFLNWGCKQAAGAAVGLKARLEAAGFPTLIVNGDCCDRSNVSEGQVMTRMNAFLEMLEGLKK